MGDVKNAIRTPASRDSSEMGGDRDMSRRRNMGILQMCDYFMLVQKSSFHPSQALPRSIENPVSNGYARVRA